MNSPPAAAVRRYVTVFLAVLALLYGGLAAFRTVADTDVGWQLATGRYLIEQGRIPRQDVFSHTAQGTEWVYPPFSGALFYELYRLGGYAALTWLGVLAAAATVGLLLRGGGLATAALAVVAAPAIALRTLPRANLFTTVLFAAVFALLWQHHRRGNARLWLLPLLMLAWVNLHLGFIAGLVALAAYVALELLEMVFRERRAAAAARLRRAWPWLAAGAAATLLNPWGPRIYAAIARQAGVQEMHTGFVSEWGGMHFSEAALRQALAWRDPWSAYWWLLGSTAATCALALRRRQVGAALLLGGAALLSWQFMRFQGLFVIVAVVVAGSVFEQCRPRPEADTAPGHARRRLSIAAPVLLAALMTALAATRVADLVSNRYYLSAGEIPTFGAGPAWWYPERAAAFLLRERLPGRLINDYNLGGFLIWRLGGGYPVYIDGRAIPYGRDLFLRHRALLQQPLDSAAWREEAEARNLNTLILSVARYPGLGSTPLRDFCASRAWRPVYLDEVAAIFVRNRPENAEWLNRLQLDCNAVAFAPPASRDAAGLYNFFANSGSVLAALGRHAEALEALQRAGRIFPSDPHLWLMTGSVLQAVNRNRQAEDAYRQALRLSPGEQSWYALGHALAAQARYAQAAAALKQAARLSASPSGAFRVLTQVYLAAGQPRDALGALDQAERTSPYRGAGVALGAGFRAELAAARARAWQALGDLPRAISYQEEAARQAPGDAGRWLELAVLYEAQGRAGEAESARRRARETQAGGAPAPQNIGSSETAPPSAKP